MKISKLIGALILGIIVGYSVISYSEQGDYATLGYNSAGGYSYWRVDSTGHFVPGAGSLYNIGSASLPIATVYANTVSGAAITGTSATFSGQISLQSVSSTTIATLVPSAVGALIYDNTRSAICIGTATVAGAWIFQSSNPITTPGISCHE